MGENWMADEKLPALVAAMDNNSDTSGAAPSRDRPVLYYMRDVRGARSPLGQDVAVPLSEIRATISDHWRDSRYFRVLPHPTFGP